MTGMVECDRAVGLRLIHSLYKKKVGTIWQRPLHAPRGEPWDSLHASLRRRRADLPSPVPRHPGHVPSPRHSLGHERRRTIPQPACRGAHRRASRNPRPAWRRGRNLLRRSTSSKGACPPSQHAQRARASTSGRGKRRIVSQRAGVDGVVLRQQGGGDVARRRGGGEAARLPSPLRRAQGGGLQGESQAGHGALGTVLLAARRTVPSAP